MGTGQDDVARVSHKAMGMRKPTLQNSRAWKQAQGDDALGRKSDSKGVKKFLTAEALDKALRV